MGTELRKPSELTMTVKTAEHDYVQTRKRRVRAFVNLPAPQDAIFHPRPSFQHGDVLEAIPLSSVAFTGQNHLPPHSCTASDCRHPHGRPVRDSRPFAPQIRPPFPPQRDLLMWFRHQREGGLPRPSTEVTGQP